MSELVITLQRVRCDEVTDDFLEGLTDEFGWRLTVYDMGGKPVITDASHEAWLEFWDQDTFSEDDLLGRIEIRRDGDGRLLVTPSLHATLLDDGSFNLTGHMGDYTIWLQFDER
jgi:hypothetical protein